MHGIWVYSHNVVDMNRKKVAQSSKEDNRDKFIFYDALDCSLFQILGNVLNGNRISGLKNVVKKTEIIYHSV